MSDEEDVEFVDDEDSEEDEEDDDGLTSCSISSKLSDASTVLSGSVSNSSVYNLSREFKLVLLL